MFTINDTISIPESEFEWSFVRSGGPGGQNVNKVASKAVLRWHVAGTQSLPPEVRSRFQIQQRHRITTEGDLVLSSQRYRDQDRNRTDCLEKLRAMVLQALAVPKARKKTKPGKAAHQRRLTAKRHHSAAKERRRTPVGE
jgi:ribosome-associated protein